jgi:diketogulonate reductase-like aldo/keto reductase
MQPHRRSIPRSFPVKDLMLSRRAVLKWVGVVASGALLDGENAMASTESTIARKIPSSGEAIPCVGIGTSKTFDVSSPEEREQVKQVMRDFARLGGRVVDTSPMYGAAESAIGEAITQLDIAKKLFLATKVWIEGREAGIEQARESMRRMKTTKLDLIQVHNLLDVDTHLEWLKEWKQKGQVRYIGVTHYAERAYSDLEKHVVSKQLDFVQFNYSMAEREAEKSLLPAALASGTAVIVNRPFARASLFERVKGRPLPEWASEFDAASWAEFFLKYILAHPAVTCVIPATRNPKHLADDMRAGRGRLPDEKMRRRMLAYLGSL